MEAGSKRQGKEKYADKIVNIINKKYSDCENNSIIVFIYFFFSHKKLQIFVLIYYIEILIS